MTRLRLCGRFALVFAKEKIGCHKLGRWGRPDSGEGVYLYRKQRLKLCNGYLPGRILVREQSSDKASVVRQVCIGFC